MLPTEYTGRIFPLLCRWSAKWTATVAEALAAKAAADKADEDARTMRHKAIDRGELAEEVANLTKQKRRLEARVVDLEEAKHLQKLIAEGQKDILKKQQRESEEEAVQVGLKKPFSQSDSRAWTS